jgi:uncharacterized membrane protein
MKRQEKLITGVVVGAGAMYLLDPQQGSRRRSRFGDGGLHSPGTRLILAAVGGLIAFKGARTRGLGGNTLSLLGLGLVARAASNQPARNLVGLGARRRVVEIEKTFTVAAPVEQVWELWSNFESFPKFMSHLREVRKIDEGRSHWVAVGPAEVPVAWDAVVTDWVPNQFIGWESVEGSMVQTTGRVRFRSTPDGGTRIEVQLSYSPPAGAAGHAKASLFGADPKQAMDEDLGRLKTLLEQERAGGLIGQVIAGAPSRRSSKSSPSRRRKPRE